MTQTAEGRSCPSVTSVAMIKHPDTKLLKSLFSSQFQAIICATREVKEGTRESRSHHILSEEQRRRLMSMFSRMCACLSSA